MEFKKPPINVWNPIHNGLSLSALELWLVNKVAFELKYFRQLEPVEEWNKNTRYGSLIQAGIEGYIKTSEIRGLSKFIQNEFERQIKQHLEAIDDITWWSRLAEHTCNEFIVHYAKELKEFNFTKSEARHKVKIELPSGREICLSAYIDGENETSIMENKCRADWNPKKIADEIDLNLQYNYYCMLWYAEHDALPEYVWYQHIRRPGGFGYHGPKQKVKESKEEYLKRICEHITDNRDDYFYRFVGRPKMDTFLRFTHKCLYPILEAFVDWYLYMIHPDRKNQVNRYHWMTPYGLYNPYLEGTDERFRQFALTGSTVGLSRVIRDT